MDTQNGRKNAQKRKHKRLVVVNKRRFVFASLLLLFVISTLFSILSGAWMSEAFSEKELISIEIVPGDTLWEIASKFNFYNEDIREVIHRIKTYNHLEDGQLIAGEMLVVPLSNK